MIVMIGEDAIYPHPSPAVLREQLLAAQGLALRLREHLRVVKQRQIWVVGDATVVLEEVLLYFGLSV
jgi:hypothetical protein